MSLMRVSPEALSPSAQASNNKDSSAQFDKEEQLVSWTFSLRWFVVGYVALVVAATLVMWTVNHNQTQVSISELSLQLRTQILQRVEDVIRLDLTSMFHVAREILYDASNGLLDDLTETDLVVQQRTITRFAGAMKAHSLDGIYIGWRTAASVGAYRTSSGVARSWWAPANNGTIMDCPLANDTGITDMASSDCGAYYYNVLERPWYTIGSSVEIGDITTTPVYPYALTEFDSSVGVGITVVSPLVTRSNSITAILAMDINLTSLQLLMKGFTMSQNSNAFVLNAADSQLVALRTGKFSRGLSDGSTELLSAEQTDRAEVREAVSVLKSGHGASQSSAISLTADVAFEITAGGSRYFASFTPIQLEGGIDWVIGVVILRSDIMAAVEKATRRSFGATAAVIVGSALFSVVSVGVVVLPISRLTRDMQRLSLLEFYHLDHWRPSHLQEITSLQSSFLRLKAGLVAFSKYVPSNVVYRLLRNNTDVTLGLKPFPLSILFVDIESFTTLCQVMTINRLIEQISELFDLFSNIILDNSGTIDKYIGDCIMAFWGAPERIEDHAYKALCSATQCVTGLRDLHHKWLGSGPDYQLLNVRMGLHCGKEVLVGNFGSTKRMNYTCIGDAVNLSSRLESLNKLFNTKLLISDDLLQAVKDRCGETLRWRCLGRICVKGRSTYSAVHEVRILGETAVAEITPGEQLLLREYAHGLELFHAKQFDAAEQIFSFLAEKFSDRPAQYLITMCQYFRASPPAADWAGELVMQVK